MENYITTLFLDIGGVLLSNGWSHESRAKAVDKFNLDLTELEYRHQMFFAEYEEGKITLEEYLQRVVFYEKRNFTTSQFRDFMFEQTTPHLDMFEFCKKLKKKYGLQVVAVSNEARELNDYRIQTFHLKELIDFFISSCYVHVRKPQVDIFKLSLDIAQVQPAQVVFIDDVEIFTKIAAELGIQSIHHLNVNSTANRLKDLGLFIEVNEINHV